MRAQASAASLEALQLLGLLGRVQQRLLLPLAATTAALAARSAWFACGYRSRSDFVRERCARSDRWFRDLLRLHDAVTRLPELGVALGGRARGTPLGHKAVVCLARVARPESVWRWIAKARKVALVELQMLVTAASEGEDKRGETEPEPGDSVDAAMAHVRMQGPPEVQLAYAAARGLHAAVVGREVGTGAFVEALVGEAASAGCELPEDLRAKLLRRWQREAGVTGSCAAGRVIA